jgi:energy-coupling factor transport system permease protein
VVALGGAAAWQARRRTRPDPGEGTLVRPGLHRRGEPPIEAPLHAAAWWLWAIGLAGAASRTTNPLLLGLILAVAGYVVAARRTDAPWAGSFGVFLRLAVVVICIRTTFHVLLGGVSGTTVLVTLPGAHAAGVGPGDPPRW